MRAASPNGREVARKARNAFEARGVPAKQLKRCGANFDPPLPGCVKTYLGAPTAVGPGTFGMVFVATANPEVLLYLAFGVRHMPAISFKPTVYQRAHKRLQAWP